MLTLFVVALGASVSSKLPPFNLKPSPRVAMRCTGRCADQYRIPASSDDTDADPQTMKARALADDGSKCNVVGAMRCLSKRRVMLRSSEDPVDTWRGSFLPK